MKTFTNLADIVLNGEPGDRFTSDESASKSRRITTHVFIERTSETAAVLDNIVTHHFGKAEYVGRPDRVYISTVRPIPTEIRGAFISQSFGVYDGLTKTLVAFGPVARYAAKGLTLCHAEALAKYDDLKES